MSRDAMDFIIVVEDASGRRRRSMTSDAFRAASDCPRDAFLGDCIKRWNARQERLGYEDRARLEIEIKRRGGRRAGRL